MNQNFSVKKWPYEPSLEEICLEVVQFWVQIKGLPLNLCIENNDRLLSAEMGEFVELEDLTTARGFIRVKILVNSGNPLIMGRWLPRSGNTNSWIEFRYKLLQDFCYKYGRIGHINTDFFQPNRGGAAGYGEWIKAKWPTVENGNKQSNLMA